MILTDKCKTDFERWLKQQEYGHDMFIGNIKQGIFCTHVTSLPESVQYALITEFFDSVGIYIKVVLNYSEHTWLQSVDYYFTESTYPSRTEALKAAIEQANLIYNSKA